VSSSDIKFPDGVLPYIVHPWPTSMT